MRPLTLNPSHKECVCVYVCVTTDVQACDGILPGVQTLQHALSTEKLDLCVHGYLNASEDLSIHPEWGESTPAARSTQSERRMFEFAAASWTQAVNSDGASFTPFFRSTPTFPGANPSNKLEPPSIHVPRVHYNTNFQPLTSAAKRTPSRRLLFLKLCT